MATNAELRARPDAIVCHLLLIDGVPFAFTDNSDLINWWQVDDRKILPGLSVPSIKMEIDQESGIPREDQVTFKILDVDGQTLPLFFGNLDKPYTLLGPRLQPTEDPAPSATLDNYGDVLTLHDGTDGSYLGTEAIGPEGQRHYYSCMPWVTTWPGQDHGAVQDPWVVHTTSTIGPYLTEGRRVVLYRLVYDPDAGDWMTPAEQYEGGARFWWGTLRSVGTVDGKTWSISCFGIGSWLRKTLNSRAPTTWYKVVPDLELTPQESKIKVRFFKKWYQGTVYEYGWDDNTYTITGTSIAQIVSDIQTAIAAVKNAAGDDGVWTDNVPNFDAAADVEFSANAVSVWTQGPNADTAAIMSLGLHWKVWRLLGYDPEAGLGVHVEPQPQFIADFQDQDYYFGSFSTTPFGEDVWSGNNDKDWDGNGVAHVYNPPYQGGLVVLPGAGKFSLKLQKPDASSDPIYLESQRIRPPASSVELYGLNCDATRWWVFRGKIQRPTGIGEVGEPEDLYQVAKCSWVESINTPGAIEQDNGLDADLWVEEWCDPRLFGLNYKPIEPGLGWAGTISGTPGEGGVIAASPLAVWGVWNTSGPSGYGTDRIDYTIHRILVGTGTGTWDAGVDDPGDAGLLTAYPVYGYLVVGDNHNAPQAAPIIASDVEIADLSLAIPYQMVDWTAIGNAVFDLPEALRYGKVCAHGPVQSEDLLAGILSSRDLSFSLEGGRYGLYRRSRTLTLEDATITITPSDLAGTAGAPASTWPSAQIRATNPFDTAPFSYTANPVDDPVGGQVEAEFQARDLASRARQGRVKRDGLVGPDLRAREWWTDGKTPAPVHDWSVTLRTFWEQEVSTWLAKPHRLIQGVRISRPKGQYIYPGTVLAFTDPRPLNSSGSYGYNNAVARVLSVTHESTTWAAVCDLLVQATPAEQQIWAPIARVIDDVTDPEDRYDPETRTFSLQPWPDGVGYNIAAFREPQWSNAGGDARFWVLQYDGGTGWWVKTCEGYVESIDAGAGKLVHTDDGLDGTWYSRMHAVIVMAPYDDADQAPWPKSAFPILSPPNGLPESRKLT